MRHPEPGAQVSLMRAFLTAEWRYLLFFNYAIDPGLLLSRVPNGVELDSWNGTTYCSMVGFLFLRTRISGLPVPLHTRFEEVNLRFYVRRRTPEGWRRGVVFIKEIVPKRLIAAVARLCYNEPYAAMPMRHRIELDHGRLRTSSLVEYAWHYRGQWNSLGARTISEPVVPMAGSHEEFITEHYWGYTPRRGGGCGEYHVNHVRWSVMPGQATSFQCDTASLYGPEFTKPLNAHPQSVFVAEGSPVTVYSGTVL